MKRNLICAIIAAAVSCLATVAVRAQTSIDVPITVTHATTTLLPTPPAGFHWVQTFGDEFATTFANSGTSTAPVTLDTSHWQIDHYCGNANATGGYAPPIYGCNGATTASDTVSGGLLTMTIQQSAPSTRNIIDTGYLAYPPAQSQQPITPFQQRYGYFVYDAKLPTCTGDEFDLESFGGTGPGDQIAYGELGWVSQVGNSCHYRNLRAYEGYATGGARASFSFYPDPDVGVDITQAFHQYGLLWKGPTGWGDATAHGSVSVRFDGTDETGDQALISAAFDAGIYFDIFWGCPGPNQGGTCPASVGNMQFDWIRAYQLVAN